MAFEVGATAIFLALAATPLAAGSEPAAAGSEGERIQLQAAPESVEGGAAPVEAPPAPSAPKAKSPAPPAASEGEGEPSKKEEGSESPAEEGAPPEAGAAPEVAPPVVEGAAPAAPPDTATPPDATPPAVTPDATPDATPPAVTPDATPPAATPDAVAPPAEPSAGVAPAASALAAEVAPTTPAAQPSPTQTEVQVGLANTVVPAAPGNAAQPTTGEDKPSAQSSMQLGLAPGQVALSGLSVTVGAQTSVGYSTFLLGSEFERDPMVDWSLSLSPAYFFADNTRISANMSLSQELTLSGGDDAPQTLIFGDIGLSVSRPLYRFQGGPTLLGSLSMQLPTSESSRTETLVTSLGGRVSAAQPLGDFFLSLGTAYRKNFHRYTNPVRDPNTGDAFVTEDGLVIEEIVTGLARSGGSELSGTAYFDGESSNTSMIWSNSLTAVYSATDSLSLIASYSLSHSWTYNSYELDELSGEGARAGRGRSDSHGGTLAANYQLSRQLGFGLGMSTFGPTRTADDKRIRFPFFAFEGKENNLTVFSFSVSYTESIGL